MSRTAGTGADHGPLPVFGLLDRGISQNSSRLDNMPLIHAVCFNFDILSEQSYSVATIVPFLNLGGGVCQRPNRSLFIVGFVALTNELRLI